MAVSCGIVAARRVFQAALRQATTSLAAEAAEVPVVDLALVLEEDVALKQRQNKLEAGLLNIQVGLKQHSKVRPNS